MSRTRLSVACCLVSVAIVASAQQTTRAGGAFERAIVPGAAGPNILPVDAVAVVGSRSGFADLRITDANGAEVPYLLVEPAAGERRWRGGTVRRLPATKERSGVELELARTIDADAVRIGGIAVPFLKRVTIEGSGDRSRWTVLAPETTVFDLPDERLTRDVVEFAPTPLRFVRIVFDDRASARAFPAGPIEVREAGIAPARAPSIALDFARPARRGEKSVVRVRLPERGYPLTAIAPRVARGAVFREAKVTELRMSGGGLAPVTLGTATLKRAEIGGEVASDLRIPIATPETAELELTIDDGSNPPLEIEGIDGEIAPQPAIFFQSADGGPLTARWGDAKLDAPRYDIEALRPRLAAIPSARASWGAPRGAAVRPRSEGVELSIPAGAKVDPDAFRWSRAIRGGNGLVAVPIDAAALAHGTPGADYRIVDVKKRQVPYLLESGGERMRIELPLPRRISASGSGNVSRYEVALPYEGLPSGAIVLRTSADFFQREVSLIRPPAEPRGAEAEISRHGWAHASEEEPAPPLTIPLPPRAAGSYILQIDERDNAPLPIIAADLLLPSYRVRYLNPTGEDLRLLYGNPKAPAPRYDLQLLADRLLAAPAVEASLGPEEELRSARTTREVAFFWAVVAIAAIALLALTARLLR